MSYFLSEEELVELCSQYGDVEQAHIVVDKTTKLSTGRGYVLFSLPDSAVRYILINFYVNHRAGSVVTAWLQESLIICLWNFLFRPNSLIDGIFFFFFAVYYP